jgi:hypothetical protein
MHTKQAMKQRVGPMSSSLPLTLTRRADTAGFAQASAQGFQAFA